MPDIFSLKITRRAILPLLLLLFAWSFVLFPNASHKVISRVPRVKIGYPHPPRSPFNETKVALLIEGRALPHLTPLLLHYMSVVPPDWRFKFFGSDESVKHLNRSRVVRAHITDGKLDIAKLPEGMSMQGQEATSQTFTNLTFYRDVLAPAEFLLVFQTDAMLCANSKQDLDDWLKYDWVGASWRTSDRFGGNGGLSIRRVSKIITVLENQVRIKHSEPEDVWLTSRMGLLPGARMANGTEQQKFSAEMIYSEKPMGFHTGNGGAWLHGGVWGTPDLRRQMWEYCPEIKMMLPMDEERFIDIKACPSKQNWKRDVSENPATGVFLM
ncbi:hypothetical protein H072_2751 [Dactylellina haptotyla CBS 200.50]|uniref:DUF5672 domain-containing protein n=1 Tax=Dactylellina haptotyla (strain CBS 200.50) TaxID=1284197 RepID=S8AK38_DACHA|nr:hypothetical protein H072_2751 [Dactylellina haptotyla CBS 200.50]